MDIFKNTSEIISKITGVLINLWSTLREIMSFYKQHIARNILKHTDDEYLIG